MLGVAGGNWSMINGNFLGSRRQTTIHELGHNLGLLHAGSWTCYSAGVRVQIGDSCTAREYGDPFDAMGNIAMRHNNGWNLAKLGILAPENIETVEAPGTYSLHSALHPTAEPTVLRIPRVRTVDDDSIASWYYLEIRQTGGVFENVSDASTAGVSIRATDANSSPETLLLDANPATATFQDAPLAAGETFDGGPVRIKTLSAGGGSATVSVDLDGEPPTAPTGLSGTAGVEEVQLQWDASTDDYGVNRYAVFRDGVEIGATASTSFLESPVSLGEHEYVVYAEDATGNRSAASAPATVTVVPDEEPPTAPSGLTATAGPDGVQLEWKAAADNFGVDRYRVFRDGFEIAGIGTSTSFLDFFSSAGEHTYVVYAEDATGNRSIASEPGAATVPEVTGPTCSTATCMVTYRSTGAEATWTVPAGVAEAELTAAGARGGADSIPLLFLGRGARAVATLGSLNAGEEVTVSAGGAGESYVEGGAGGYNGGGDGTRGGGGGGFSSVAVESTLVLLAGGGGGRGLEGFDAGTEAEPSGGSGGRGGEAGTAGFHGSATEALGATLAGGDGGEPGGSGALGGSGGEVGGASACSGGALPGASGSPGDEFAGGGGAPDAGGGGGGGYLGGGQGGGGAGDECGSTAGAGGGGGGSSYVAPELEASAMFTGGFWRGSGQVSIVYANPVGATNHSYATEPDVELVVPAASGVLSGAALGAESLVAELVSAPAHGDLILDEDGSFAYSPTAGYVGGDSFAYRAADPAGDHATATVSLTVAEPSPQPSPEPTPPAPAGATPAAEPSAASSPATPPRSVSPAKVAIGSARAPHVGRFAKVRLACRGGAPGDVCRGALRLSAASTTARRVRRHAKHARDRRGSGHRRISLGSTRYALASGRARWVAVRLRPRALRRLARSARRAVRVRATATAAGGHAHRAIVLRLARPRGMHKRFALRKASMPPTAHLASAPALEAIAAIEDAAGPDPPAVESKRDHDQGRARPPAACSDPGEANRRLAPVEAKAAAHQALGARRVAGPPFPAVAVPGGDEQLASSRGAEGEHPQPPASNPRREPVGSFFGRYDARRHVCVVNLFA